MPVGSGATLGPVPRDKVVDTLRLVGVTVLNAAGTSQFTLRKGSALLSISLPEKVPEPQLQYLARTFRFQWLKFHNPAIDIDPDDPPC